MLTEIKKTINIGCGGIKRRAGAGFDVYTDIMPAREELDGLFVQTPAEDMHMFGDKEFDYAVCHHVIEHVVDPDLACAEIVRIAKAGRISFPPMQAEIQFGRRDHNWFVAVDKGRLLFIKKRHASYGIPRSETGCQLNVDFDWVDSFSWKVVE